MLFNDDMEVPTVDEFAPSNKLKNLIAQYVQHTGDVDEDMVLEQMEFEGKQYSSAPLNEMEDILGAKMNAMYVCMKDNNVVMQDKNKDVTPQNQEEKRKWTGTSKRR